MVDEGRSMREKLWFRRGRVEAAKPHQDPSEETRWGASDTRCGRRHVGMRATHGVGGDGTQ